MTAPPELVLRARRESDQDALYAIAAELDTWEERNPGPPAPLTRAAFDARDLQPEEGRVSFVIELDGEPAGTISLGVTDSLARHAEMGVALAVHARGRGVGTEAIRQVVAFGFERRNLRRIHLQAIASNAAALRAYEKAGFTIEGRLREHAWVRGGYEDIVLMAILRDQSR